MYANMDATGAPAAAAACWCAAACDRCPNACCCGVVFAVEGDSGVTGESVVLAVLGCGDGVIGERLAGEVTESDDMFNDSGPVAAAARSSRWSGGGAWKNGYDVWSSVAEEGEGEGNGEPFDVVTGRRCGTDDQP